MKFSRGLLLFLTVILVSLFTTQSLAQEPERCIDTPCGAIMSAFRTELEDLLEATTEKKEHVILGKTVTTGVLEGHDVYLGLSGVSMTNPAAMAQKWFDTFDTSYLLFSGIAGGVNPDVNIGDVVVPAQWSHYQEFHFCREINGEFGCESDLPNFGMMFPRSGVSVCTVNGPVDQCERIRWFQVDKKMLQVARRVAKKIELVQCGLDRKGNEVCLDQRPGIKTGGNGVSASAFIDNLLFRIWAWEAFEADALDMETSAAAHVAYMNDIPFIAFRSVSDLAGGGPGENQIGAFFRIASINSSMTLRAFLKEWKK